VNVCPFFFGVLVLCVSFVFCYLASFWEYRLHNLRVFSVSQLQAWECFQLFTNGVCFLLHCIRFLQLTIKNRKQYYLPILTDIQPAELRRSRATLFLARRAMEPRYLLHSALTRPSSANVGRLISRHPFIPDAQHLISSSDNNRRAAQWADN